MAASVLVLALLAGCNRMTEPGVPTADGGAPEPSTTQDLLALMGEWAQCMRDQGFDVPDPYLDAASGTLTFGFEGPGKGDPMEELYVTAMQVCEPYERAFQEIGREPFTDEAMALWRTFTQCMREHGVEMDDPDQASGLPPVPDPDRYRGQIALLEQALTACNEAQQAARTAR